MNVAIERNVRILLHQLIRYRFAAVGVFVTVNLIAVAVGLTWPKSYTSSTAIFVEQRNIIQPLMQGAAVATTVTDRAKIAREVIFSKKITNQVIEHGGFVRDGATNLEKQRIIDSLIKRTMVRNVGPNLIKIEYTDANPKRAYEVTKRYADLFIAESMANQSQESEAAFEFIDSQVKEYHAKLKQAEENLKKFKTEHVDARPGSETEVSTKINTLEATIEKTSLQLKEAQIKKESLAKQLSGEAVITTSLTREGQYLGRIADLQAQLDTLRLSYHDTHPDVVHIKHQIEDLKEAARAERERREAAQHERESHGQVFVDEGVRVNPLYTKMKSELFETNTEIETLAARLAESRRRLQEEVERARRVHGGEALLAELTRDYNVNRDIYQDLLRRRENARVSKNLDRDRQGLTLRIQEPAAVPVEPSGLRFMHFAVGGLLLGLLLPPGILIAIQQVDPRVCSALAIADRLRVPVLATIPHLATPQERYLLLSSFRVLAAIALVTFGFVITTASLRYFAVI